jgi:hypothetical protein
MHFWKSCRKDEREILPAAEEPALPGPGTCRNGQTVGLTRIESVADDSGKICFDGQKSPIQPHKTTFDQ